MSIFQEDELMLLLSVAILQLLLLLSRVIYPVQNTKTGLFSRTLAEKEMGKRMFYLLLFF